MVIMQNSKQHEKVTQRNISVPTAPRGSGPLDPLEVREAERMLTVDEIFAGGEWDIKPHRDSETAFIVSRVNVEGMQESMLVQTFNAAEAFDNPKLAPGVTMQSAKQLQEGQAVPFNIDPGTTIRLCKALRLFRYSGDNARSDMHVRALLAGLNKKDASGEVSHAATSGTVARMFVAAYGDEIMYARGGEGGGTWYEWKDFSWQTSSADQIATQFAAPFVGTLVARAEWQARAQHIDTLATFNGCVAYARGHAAVGVDAADLDTNPLSLGTPGGVVDLATGRAMVAVQADRVTRSTPVAPEADAADGWLGFIDWAMSGEQDRIDWLQEALGMSLIGKVLDEAFFVCVGAGANGKTVLFEVIRGVLGTVGTGGYAQNAPRGFLTSGIERHQTEIARMAGARFVTVSETRDGAGFDEDKVKHLSSTNELSGNFMRSDIVDFRPTHTMWIGTNHLPKVGTGGTGFYRRMKIVEFKETLKEQHQKKRLADDLVENEGGQILSWLIEGARRYIDRGRLPECAAVDEAGRRFRLTQECLSAAEFVSDYCVIERGQRVGVSDLFEDYLDVCEALGSKSLGNKAFSIDVDAIDGIERKRGNKGVRFMGVNLASR